MTKNIYKCTACLRKQEREKRKNIIGKTEIICWKKERRVMERQGKKMTATKIVYFRSIKGKYIIKRVSTFICI